MSPHPWRVGREAGSGAVAGPGVQEAIGAECEAAAVVAAQGQVMTIILAVRVDPRRIGVGPARHELRDPCPLGLVAGSV